MLTRSRISSRLSCLTVDAGGARELPGCQGGPRSAQMRSPIRTVAAGEVKSIQGRPSDIRSRPRGEWECTISADLIAERQSTLSCAPGRAADQSGQIPRVLGKVQPRSRGVLRRSSEGCDRCKSQRERSNAGRLDRLHHCMTPCRDFHSSPRTSTERNASLPLFWFHDSSR